MTPHPMQFQSCRFLPAALLVAAVLTLGGCIRDEPTSDAGPTVALAAQSFKRDWSANLTLRDDQIERVFVREDMVFAYTKNQQAYVINRGSGLIRFLTHITDSPVRAHPPVVLKERIVFPTTSTLEIYRRDGRFERSYETRNSLRTNATGAPNGSRVYFGVDHPGSGRMVCVETNPGDYEPVRQVWELMSDRGAAINSAPAVFQDIVFVAFDDGWVYAVNGENRVSVWSTSTGPQFKTYGPIQADLRVDEFGVYVPSTDTKFYCLNRNDGKTRWVYHAGSSLRESPEITAQSVYLPIQGKGVVAIDKTIGPKNNEPRWTFADGVRFLAEDDKFTYLQRRDNMIVALDRVTGELAFTNKRTDLIAFGSNTRNDGIIYAATRDGRVVAISPVLKAGFMGEVAMWQPASGDQGEALAMR